MTENTELDRKTLIRTAIGFVGYLFVNPFILFVNAGTTEWGMAWVYFGIAIVLTIGSRILARRNNPDLLQELARSQTAEDTKKWDRVLASIAALYAPMAAIIVAGLDFRNAWTNDISLLWQILALILATLGFIFASWAMIENRFFSAVVRIQKDRGHNVCNSGTYRIVRHPGYAGGIVWYVMTPLVLNSTWALIPISISVIATIIRTALEDRTLQDELPGYKEYTQESRYRLLPGFW
ncbi:MAG: isoprenylcysteine carboxylmethyltransferase family protein [Chloroflexi bacterium]|nr:isoprenylcysteine carboxylmethyltransferase family protein [Chloroflexota bacterium]